MNRKTFLPVYVLILIIGACGDDEKEGDKGSDNDGQTKIDTASVDSLDGDTLSEDIVSGDTVNIDTMKLDVKEESSIEKSLKGEEAVSDAAKEVFKTFDLSKYGYNITISLPERTKITVNDFDEAVLTFGEDFILEVGENYDGTPKEVKSRFKGNMHNQLMGYVIEDDQGFVRKIKSNGVISHNLFYTVNDGKMDLTIKSPMGQAYSQDEILTMWKAVQTVKVKE